MTHFTTLYNLAHLILTAPGSSALGKLSIHSGLSNADAHTILRRAILQATMPGERGDDPWGVVRVFMRNLVNRAFAPVSGIEMVNLLAGIEADPEATKLEQKIELLSKRVAQRSEALACSLNTLRSVTPLPGQSYIEWLMQKASYYAQLPIDHLDPDQVIADIRVIASDVQTKIPNIGIALAANLLADLGAPALAKPDKHVILTTLSLMPTGASANPELCIRKVIEIAKQEAPVLALKKDYQWLINGLQPRHLDRLIYLVGSDNFLLNGDQNKRRAPIRRQLMFTALKSECTQITEVITKMPVSQLSQREIEQKIYDEVEIINHNDRNFERLNAKAEITFYDKLEGKEDARRFLDELIDLAATESCEVHYTFTNGADIRIRAFQDLPHRREQNVIVITWRPMKGGFACQLFSQVERCREVGLLTAESQPQTNSPLRTKVFLDPTNKAQIVAFGLATLRSIRDFCHGRHD